MIDAQLVSEADGAMHAVGVQRHCVHLLGEQLLQLDVVSMKVPQLERVVLQAVKRVMTTESSR